MGIGLGASGADRTGALGANWISEPKIILSLVTWTFFFVLLSVRKFSLIRAKMEEYRNQGKSMGLAQVSNQGPSPGQKRQGQTETHS